MYITRDFLRGDTHNLFNSGIATNKIIITKFFAPAYNEYSSQIWRSNPEMQRHRTVSYLLPIGSIFILGMVILFMVLFKRYPHIVTAIVGAFIGIIIIVTIMVSLNYGPVYT